MQENVFQQQQRLSVFPPVKLLFIIRRRLVEQGFRTTLLWVQDKLARRFGGYSPREISQVAPGLFVGGQYRQPGMRGMRECGITAVVNLRQEYDDAAHGLRLDDYLWLPTPDDAPISVADLLRGAQFIKEQLAAGHGVYIHCASGVGRAPTMAAAYLISTGLSAEEAWTAIRRGRPFIRPTPPQIDSIAEFARQRAGSRKSG